MKLENDIMKELYALLQEFKRGQTIALNAATEIVALAAERQQAVHEHHHL